jgi:hypothetical protein
MPADKKTSSVGSQFHLTRLERSVTIIAEKRSKIFDSGADQFGCRIIGKPVKIWHGPATVIDGRSCLKPLSLPLGWEGRHVGIALWLPVVSQETCLDLVFHDSFRGKAVNLGYFLLPANYLDMTPVFHVKAGVFCF